MTMRLIDRAALGVFVSWLLAWSVCAQPSPCDPELLQLSPGGDLAYRHRGDRCEGRYAQEVAARATLQLSSVTDWFPNIEPGAVPRLEVAWSAPRRAHMVNVRATSLRYQLYYRMDAVRRAADGRFGWPTDVISSLDVRRRELGLLAWTVMVVGERRRDVYLPLRIGEASHATPRQVQVIVVPSVELHEVYYTVTHHDANGARIGAPTIRDRPLRLGMYPANRSIPINVPAAATPRFYRVDVRAATVRHGSLARSFWLFYG